MVWLPIIIHFVVLKLSVAALCHFDASCSCSSPPPHLGQVECINTRVSLSRINSSKLFSFALVNNDIDYLPPNLFEGTGLYRFHLSDNAIYQLEEDVFRGVERSLWELHLTYCKLSIVPFKAIRHLQKLKTLNLTGNAIINISADQLRGVSNSLQALILSENRISFLPDGIFSMLRALEVLNLRGNSLTTLEPAGFSPPPPRLVELDLSDNNFKTLNYRQLGNLKVLKYLDLSLNLIADLPDTNSTTRLTVDSLYLDYNNITELESFSFANFAAINKTSFKGNPLRILQPNAFKPCKIEELYLTDCQLGNINPEAFDGLDDTLKILDLSGNNITTFGFPVLKKLFSLTTLRVDYNKLSNYDWLTPPGIQFPTFQLLELSIRGTSNAPVAFQKFPRLPHLQTLAFSLTPNPNLNADMFENFSFELEILKIDEGSIKNLNAGIFKHIRGIKTLDLTDNTLDSVDAQTFIEVSHSLERLILTHSLSSKIGDLPAGLLKPLSSLTELKINHNLLRKLPNDVRWLSNLEILHAHDNIIDILPNTLFKGNAHKNLREIILCFNKIAKIDRGTFTELERLKIIDLSENDIASIETGAFNDLPKVKTIFLRGNKIASLSRESFQNLPHLEKLDLSYNSLKYLSMSSLDQVGTLSTMLVNASHNAISSLLMTETLQGGRYSVYGTIKVIDFSYNKISDVDSNYFAPIQDSLAHLILSHNEIRNLSRDMLPELPQLQHLDVSYNKIYDVEFDSLRSIPLLQGFFINGNEIKELPPSLFSSSTNIECLDFADNLLGSLTDSLITTMSPLKIDIGFNNLTRIPLSSFSPSSAIYLRELILRSNKITRLPTHEAFSRFSNLRHLDLSDNKLFELGNSFNGLVCLTKLSLSYNRIRFDTNDWRGQERSLKHLELSNTSLSYVPALPLPSLLTLKLANNGIAYLPSDLQTNLTELKMLDASNNIISEMTPFPQLTHLNLASNPISSITNSTFTYFSNLAELDLRRLPLTYFDADALGQIALTTLALSNYKEISSFNIPSIVRDVENLHHLIYEVVGIPSIGKEMLGSFSNKIRHITLRGTELKSLPGTLLQGFPRAELRLSLQNTSVEQLESSIFKSPSLRNISLDLETSGALKTVTNPSNSVRPNVPHSAFLLDFKLKSQELNCDCTIGWIETWTRKRRQMDPTARFDEDLRASKCKNKQGKSLMDVLRTELECGWSGTIRCSKPNSSLLLSLLLLLLFAFLQ